MPIDLPNVKASLGKKLGPLTGKQWLMVGGVAGIGYYLWRRSHPVAVTEEATGEGSPTASTGETYLSPSGGYGEGYGGVYVAPMPSSGGGGYTDPTINLGEPTSVSVPIEFTSEPLEPVFVDCGQGYILDILGRCIPDPSLVAVPTPDGGQTGGGGNAQRKIARITARIHALQEGGVTAKERPKVKALRATRKEIRTAPPPAARRAAARRR